MKLVTVICVVLVVLFGSAEAACEDEASSSTCRAYKGYCEADSVKWSSGQIFWERCKKTCDKCTEKEEENKEAEESKEAKESDACEDTYSTCEAYKSICTCGKFSDGTTLWSKCKKTCGCCDGSCAARDAAKAEAARKQKEAEEAAARGECANTWSKCDTYSHLCKCGKFSDGDMFWEKCPVTCGKCEDKEKEEESENKEEEKDDSKDDASCTDEYGSSCTGNEDMCESGQWGDGTNFWKYCEKTCSCCDGSCQKRQAKLDAACGEKGSGPSASYFKSDTLAKHNELRAKHQNTPSMTWDNSLQEFAQGWCDGLAKADTGLRHSDRSGENLYMGGLMSQEVCSRVGASASQAWYNEIGFYDYTTGEQKKGSETEMIGHFTQLVWSDSTTLGCAYSLTSAKDRVYICCNYNPPGNFNNNELNKVKPLNTRRSVLAKRSEPEIVIPIERRAKGQRIVIPVEEDLKERDNEPVPVININDLEDGEWEL